MIVLPSLRPEVSLEESVRVSTVTDGDVGPFERSLQ